MSVIAQKWAYSRPITSPVAKNILAFLASHNFPGNQTFFTVQTIAGATAYSRSSVIGALKWLVENKYLKKEFRISANGSQQSNVYILNITQEYVTEYCSDYSKLSTPPVQELHPPRAGDTPPPVQELHPNINTLNNNINKRSAHSLNDKKINKEIKSNLTKQKSNFASVESQSNSYNEQRMYEILPISGILAEYMAREASKK